MSADDALHAALAAMLATDDSKLCRYVEHRGWSIARHLLD